VVSTGQAEGVYYLCVASASTVSILKYNDRLKKFCPQKVRLAVILYIIVVCAVFSLAPFPESFLSL